MPAADFRIHENLLARTEMLDGVSIRSDVLSTNDKEEEKESRDTILNADDFVIGRKNVFPPEAELMVLVLACGCVWVVVSRGCGNSARGVHSRKS